MLHRNLEWKLIALLLGLGLWAYVTFNSRVAEKSFRVPIEMGAIPRNLALVSPPGQATVWLSGDRKTLEAAADQVHVRATLQGQHAGRIRARLDAVYPTSLDFVRISPTEIELNLERIVRQSFPITTALQGEPGPGYTLGEPTLSPQQAVVSGPETAVQRVNRVVVGIDASVAMLKMPQSGLLRAVDASGHKLQNVEVEPETAIVSVPVESNIASKPLPVFIAFLGNLPAGYKIDHFSITPPLVIAAGDAAALKNLEAIYTVPLTLANINASFKRELTLVIPAGIASLSERSVAVEGKVSAAPSPPSTSAEASPQGKNPASPQTDQPPTASAQP